MISRLCLFKITWIWLISERSFRSKICFFDIEASLREVFSRFDCRERVLFSMPTSLLSSNKIEEPGLGAGGSFHLRGYCTDMPSESRMPIWYTILTLCFDAWYAVWSSCSFVSYWSSWSSWSCWWCRLCVRENWVWLVTFPMSHLLRATSRSITMVDMSSSFSWIRRYPLNPVEAVHSLAISGSCD